VKKALHKESSQMKKALHKESSQMKNALHKESSHMKNASPARGLARFEEPSPAGV
jgi:hypothetical protein